MAMDILVFDSANYQDTRRKRKQDFKDMQYVQILRGRFLHFMSILERVMKEECDMTTSTEPLKNVIPPFIAYLKKKDVHKDEVKSFNKRIRTLNRERDKWAHQVIWYRKRKGSTANQNFIGTAPLNKYFERINDLFLMVFTFLSRHDMLKIKDRQMTLFSVDDAAYNPRLQKSINVLSYPYEKPKKVN